MEPSAAKLIALDIGAESGRVMVGHLQDDRVTLEELRRFPTGAVQVGSSLYTDVLYIWGEIQSGLAQAAARYGDQLASVGVDTWGVDYALLGPGGNLLGNPHHYRDPRTDGILEKAFARVTREEIYSQTGNQFVAFNTLFQLLAAAGQEPELLSAAQTLLMLPDLFHYWLSGERVCEYTAATTSQCYDQLGQDWAWELLEAFGLPGGIFLPVTQPGTCLGPLRPELAGRLGVGQNLQVILPASHDTGSAVAAIPVSEPDFLYISSGTWSLVGVEIEQPIITPESLARNLTNEGGAGGRTRFLKIAPGMWVLQQCRQTWELQGQRYSYAELTQLASQAPAGGPLIDVSSDDFVFPGDFPARIRAYCEKTGQQAPQTVGEIVRCVLESMAVQYRLLLEDFESVLGRQLTVIHIIGGGARNELLNQMTADCTRRRVVAGPYEATALGNILVQAVGLGKFGSIQEIREVVRRSFQPQSYTPAAPDYWDERCQLFRQLVTGNDERLSN